jgi:tetratricopeptide (TPR) repeat protein
MVRERVEGALASTRDPAAQARLMMWKDTVAMIKDQPVLGHGPGSYRWLYDHYKSHKLHFWFRYAHNEYLHILAEYGVVGFALLAGTAAYVLFRLVCLVGSVQRDRDAYLVAGLLGSTAACLAHANFDYNLHLFSNMHVLVMFAGIVSACLYASGHLSARPMKALAAYMVWGGGTLLALVLLLASSQAFVSYGYSLLGDRRREKLDMDRASAYYTNAIRVDPGNWQAYLGMADGLSVLSFWNRDEAVKKEQAVQALECYEKALARNPFDTDVIHGKSKVHSMLGEDEKAIELLQAAVEFAPNDLLSLIELGLELRFAERYEEAYEVFVRASHQGVPDDVITANLEILGRIIADQQKEKGAE